MSTGYTQKINVLISNTVKYGYLDYIDILPNGCLGSILFYFIFVINILLNINISLLSLLISSTGFFNLVSKHYESRSYRSFEYFQPLSGKNEKFNSTILTLIVPFMDFFSFLF